LFRIIESFQQLDNIDYWMIVLHVIR